ncbi:MAG: uroporphyrinogen decarboxylase [Myxococcota bacterium]
MSRPAPLTPRDRVLRACRGQSTDRAPVWLMRQAGRYLPEYRKIKERASFLEMCRDAELAFEISLQPFRRFRMDAVIVFSDILLPLAELDLGLHYAPGPRIEHPVRDGDDLARLEGDVASALRPTCEAIRALREELGDEAAVIGFAGAPWTLAAYVSEPQLSRDLGGLAGLTYRDPELVDALLERMSRITAETLRLQVEAGADVVQIFDTWAGMLSRERFVRFAGAALRRVLRALDRDGPPRILFARGASHLVEELADLEPDVVSLDWRVELEEAVQGIGQRVALQGNLDPAALMAPPPEITRRVERICKAGRLGRGHILNLGHGVLPTTPIEGVESFVEAARQAESSL